MNDREAGHARRARLLGWWFSLGGVLRWGWIVGVGWLAAFALAIEATRGRPGAGAVLSGWVALAPPVLAAGLTAAAAARTAGRERALWLVVATSTGLLAAGDLVYAVGQSTLGEQLSYPWWSDPPWLASYALLLPVVVLAFGGAAPLRRVRALLDTALVCLALGAGGWSLLVAPQLTGTLSAAAATSVGYVLLDGATLVLLVSLGVAGHRRLPTPVLLLLAATVANTASDCYLVVQESYGGWTDLGWQVQAVGLCLAALYVLRGHDSTAAVVDRLDRDLGLAPVLLAVAAAFGLLGSDLLRGQPCGLSFTVTALVVAGLLGRLLLSIADGRRTTRDLDVALAQSQRLAVTDGLTGLYNRRFFQEMLHLETERARRPAGPQLSVLVFDLDHFKQVNDTHGHVSGDTVLAEAAARLRRAMRPADVLARYGGEEFVALLPGADDETAREIAERCRRAVAEEPVRLPTGDWITVTTSVGGATTSPTHTPTELVRLADRALYAAKAAGRNRVHLGPVPDAAQNQPADPAAGAAGRHQDHFDGINLLLHLADLVGAQLSSQEHSAALSHSARVLADALALPDDARERAVLSSRLHDIGRIRLPHALLTTPRPYHGAG